PAGVGKEMFANRLAQLLLCPQPAKVKDGPKLAGAADDLPAGLSPPKGSHWIDACGKCESCHLVAAGTHPDLHLVHRELHKFISELKDRKGLELYIQVIRDYLIDPAASKPARGHNKVFIIRDAHLMNDEAQNALLKTLEEPPPGTFIILLTDQVHSLLETIRSRCQLVRFAPLPVDFVREQLTGRAVGPRKIAPDEAAYLAARSAGQLGPAIAMAEADLFGLHQELATRLADLTPSGAVGLADWMEEQINTLSRERVEREDITDSQAKKEVACELLSTAALVVSDAMRSLSAHASPAAPALVPAAATKLAVAADPEDRLQHLARAIEALSRADYLIGVRFVNLRLALDEAVLTLATALPS
ncbi:MAG: hypothetical protein PHU85_20780, partial [Phycisphaerae bacterium]|nr:hypothetical protein [Phycisphaerae bacterium]